MDQLLILELVDIFLVLSNASILGILVFDKIGGKR